MMMDATADNFDALVGSPDFGDTGESVDADAPAQQELPGKRSMFDALTTPVPSVDPATGRELDGPPLPGEESEAAAEEAEEAAPEGLLAEVFGLKAEDVLEALRDGKLPSELLEHIMVGDGDDAETLGEMREGRMRHLDYSRKTRELAAERQEFDAARDAFTSMAQTWTQAGAERRQSTRRELELLGVPLLEIARDIADEHAMLDALTPAQQQAWHQQREREIALMRREQALKTQEYQSRHKAGNGSQHEHVAALRKHIGPVFKALAIPQTPTAERLLVTHLTSYWSPEQPITRDVVLRAAKAAQQELQELGMSHRVSAAKVAAPAAAKPGLSPRPRAGASSGKGAARKQFEATPDNFGEWLERGAR